MKIHARVEILPGVPITQAWEVVKHSGTPHLLFSPADGDAAVLIRLDESKIFILDKLYGLEAETAYKLFEALRGDSRQTAPIYGPTHPQMKTRIITSLVAAFAVNIAQAAPETTATLQHKLSIPFRRLHQD